MAEPEPITEPQLAQVSQDSPEVLPVEEPAAEAGAPPKKRGRKPNNPPKAHDGPPKAPRAPKRDAPMAKLERRQVERQLSPPVPIGPGDFECWLGCHGDVMLWRAGAMIARLSAAELSHMSNFLGRVVA